MKNLNDESEYWQKDQERGGEKECNEERKIKEKRVRTGIKKMRMNKEGKDLKFERMKISK